MSGTAPKSSSSKVTKAKAKATPTPPPSPSLLSWCMQRQLELSLSLLLLILIGNVVFPPQYSLDTNYTPDPSYHLKHVFSRFLFLSFRKPGNEVLYFKGRDDAYFITFYFILFWFLRDAVMRWILEPLARCAGITQKRSIIRFSEQGWAFLYAVVSWSTGMYIMQNSPYASLRTEHYYIGYPHDALPPLSKWYYLVQTAFWLQQIVVLNLEERRKDHNRMLTHHVVTVLLMTFSYVFNWTRVGNVVLCTMDFIDILLPLAKLFVYTSHQKLADFTFVVFIFSWIATRHVVYNIVLYSVAFELPVLVPHGWKPRDGYFNAVWSHAGFTGLLAVLQVLLIIWFGDIAKIAWQVVQGHPGADSRSDAGDSENGDDISEEEIILVEDEKSNGVAPLSNGKVDEVFEDLEPRTSSTLPSTSTSTSTTKTSSTTATASTRELRERKKNR